MIRVAKVEDAKEIADLDSLIFADSLGYDFIYTDIKNNPFAKYYVYLEDDVIIGYIGSWISDNTTILNFCVKEEYRNKGIGSLLFSKIEEERQGFLSLEVRVSNLGAINFYSKRGFVKAALRKNYYSNNEDAILMVKE